MAEPPRQLLAKRRTLKYLGILTGTVAGRKFLAEWLPSDGVTAASQPAQDGIPGHETGHAPHAQPESVAPYNPRFFKADEFATVETLTALIIPTDVTPGAKEAGVAAYIDCLVAAAAEFQPSLQLEWMQGLKLLDRLSRQEYQRAFYEISTRDQEALLMAMSLPERKPEASHPGFDFYRLVKEMTVEGFYTSRVGLIDVLGYKGLAFLGEFPGCTHPEHQT
jgi:hypothetical protein